MGEEPNDNEDIDRTDVAANEEAIKAIFDRLDSIENKLQVLFEGNGGTSKIAEIEQNKSFRKEIKEEGLIEMVKTNRRMLERNERLIYWILGIISSGLLMLLGGVGWTVQMLISHL